MKMLKEKRMKLNSMLALKDRVANAKMWKVREDRIKKEQQMELEEKQIETIF